MNIKLYHNPGCSKSRQALQLLREQGIEPEIVEYLKQPPSALELTHLLSRLGIPARELMRTQESAYQEAGLARADATEDELIAAITEHPILLQRPILEYGDRAVIGRPPERLLELL